LAQFLIGFGKARREGVFAVNTSIVEQITGHEPISMHDFVMAHRNELMRPPARGNGAPLSGAAGAGNESTR
jgi:hypothetical protein